MYHSISNGLYLKHLFFFFVFRRKSAQNAGTNRNVRKPYQQEESDDKLPDNVLCVPAEEFDITDGKYSTADVGTPKIANNRLSMDGNYSTVDNDISNSSNNRISMDGNYSTIELDAHLERNCSQPANSDLGKTKEKQKPTIKPKPKSACINSEDNSSPDQNIKHITPPNGSDNVYAIVDTSSTNLLTTDGDKWDGTCQYNQTYAVAWCGQSTERKI